MSEAQTETVQPWYRQRWPWYIIGLLMFGVVGSGVLVVEALRHEDPLVVDNYYKKGLAINRVLDRQRAADALGLQALASFNAAKGVLSVRLSARQKIKAPELELRFFHATLANRDYSVTLARVGTDLYRANLAKLRAGNYDLMLEPADKAWRLDAHLSMPVHSWKLVPEL